MPMYRKSMLILLLIVLAVAGGTYYGCYMQEKESIQLDAASQAVSQEDRAEITVYVTGAINKPGVVTVREGARMADVVKACGGLLPTACRREDGEPACRSDPLGGKRPRFADNRQHEHGTAV